MEQWIPIRKLQDIARLLYSCRRDVARFFTLPEAEQLLPEVERLLRSCIQSKQDYDRAESELKLLEQRITLTGGMMVAREHVAQIRNRKESAARVLKTTLEGIQGIGCQLKDVDTGLIDFPTLYHGKEVYLCWKLGESGIQFWHRVEDGFRGRRPVDEEFLSNHRGDPAH